MYFVFYNTPATFQAIINYILSDLIRTEHIIIYLDNILIHTNNINLHWKHTKEVLKRLANNDLFAKLGKCFFEKDFIKYLSIIIAHRSIKMNSTKVSGVKEWSWSKKVKRVQLFLGFANLYRQFIWDFAKIAKLLTILTQKEQYWIWTDVQENAFKLLKETFIIASILRISNFNNLYRFECDTSDLAIAVLSQQDPKTLL